MPEDLLINEFQIVDDCLNDAFVSNDPEEISKLISEDWVLLEPQFGLTSREKILLSIKSGDLLHLQMRKQVMRVKVTNDIAIVTSRGMNKGYFKTQLFDSEQWINNIYRKENERWICIMTQEAPVACK